MTTPNTTATVKRPELYFYIPGKSHPQDVAIIPAGCTYDDAVRQPVSEITEETYKEMFEVLPPMNCCYLGITASFMLAEMYSGNVTDIFARFRLGPNNYRYFRFRDLCTLTHSEIVERCNAFMQK